MTRRAYLYFILTFLLGVVVGGSAVLFYGWHSGHWHRRPDRQRIVRHMTRELKLTPPQVEQLSKIMEESFKKMSDQRKQVEPQLKAIHDETTNRIRQILTPEQLTKFNEMVRRFEDRRSRERPPPQ
jgi:Spy/CpxP family protein refolding chaperone